jgi:Methyltransferase small domain
MERPPYSETYGLNAYRVDAYVPERLVQEAFGGRALARMAARKLIRRATRGRLGGPQAHEDIVALYGGIAVFDRPEQHRGGLAFGRDFPRVLNELDIGHCGRLLEFGAGPGYIGYSLLAAGWCDTLVLTDVDREAIATARHTAAFNGLEDRVTAYVSDALDHIPDGERWDVVVANPPHFLADPGRLHDIQVFDPDWSLHRRFYGAVERFMRPGGLVVMVENRAGSDPGAFEEMIRAGGGEPREVHLGTDVRGAPNGLYYQVSEWRSGEHRLGVRSRRREEGAGSTVR